MSSSSSEIMEYYSVKVNVEKKLFMEPNRLAFTPNRKYFKKFMEKNLELVICQHDENSQELKSVALPNLLMLGKLVSSQPLLENRTQEVQLRNEEETKEKDENVDSFVLNMPTLQAYDSLLHGMEAQILSLSTTSWTTSLPDYIPLGIISNSHQGLVKTVMYWKLPDSIRCPSSPFLRRLALIKSEHDVNVLRYHIHCQSVYQAIFTYADLLEAMDYLYIHFL